MDQKSSTEDLCAWIRELENRSIETMQAREKKRKLQKNVNNTKHVTHIMEISKIEMRERKRNVFNEILAENVQILL